MDNKTLTLLSNYIPASYKITDLALTFDIHEHEVVVKNVSKYVVNESSLEKKLILNGEDLELKSIKINSKLLSTDSYNLCKDSLEIHNPPISFELELVTIIKPRENKSGLGIYYSGEILCSQMEAEGFRKVTYSLDRPDVMSKFEVSIFADKDKYPYLLSNGNLLEQGNLEHNRHYAKWADPFPKPCYLFAIVAGKLELVEDKYLTKSEKNVTLQIYVEPGNEHLCQHAMTSLKKSMRWDEDTYGLEYDLERFMIVAVNDFNAGAMENKGLNIFNAKYVLADPKIATDLDYHNIESIIAHEYFHNWTGNRVTCRDWFQLTLKEGLTVYRDQEFSADMHSRVVQRVDAVADLRNTQFIEDEGPNAHPIQPESYIEIDNFYTSTVYDKGAEVIRMIEKIVGTENFKKGIRKYFELYDGQAVTTEDFIKAFELATGFDLKIFRRWYKQAGTPKCTITSSYDIDKKTYSITIEQILETKYGKKNEPFLIPITISLLNKNGKSLPLPDNKSELTLIVKEQKETFYLKNINEKPVLSLLRNFSAPINIEYNYSNEDLVFLAKYDSDGFNRYEALQKLLISEINNGVNKDNYQFSNSIYEIFEYVLSDQNIDYLFKATLLEIPQLSLLLQKQDVYKFDETNQIKEKLYGLICKQYQEALIVNYRNLHDSKNSNASIRRLKNVLLDILIRSENDIGVDLAYEQFSKADNMTDQYSALLVLRNANHSKRVLALESFKHNWSHNSLVLNKWFAAQALSELPETVMNLKQLVNSELFDRYNPNNLYSLYLRFSNNLLSFHNTDGSGYSFIADSIKAIDRYNPNVAARIATCFNAFNKLDSVRKAKMQSVLKDILNQKDLSGGVYEIISKTLKLC
jgi:aminopeptidase N